MSSAPPPDPQRPEPDRTDDGPAARPAADDAAASATGAAPEQSAAGGGPAGPDAAGNGDEPERARRPLDTGSAPPAKPSRGALSVRDMLVAMGVIIVIAVLFTRSCSFSPGGPTVEPGSAPVVDAVARLQDAAPFTPFALHVPTVPAGWRANSADSGPVQGGGHAVRVGYLTDGGAYVRLVQSDATEEDLVATEAGGPQTATGTVDVAGLTWVTYRVGPRNEAMWVAPLPSADPPSRLLLTGSATEADFRTLAQAAVDGRPLPVGRTPS
ncbi:hypothetical protein PSU4_34290 [Pseudonocardia sulfidoxydans NBRC 16205]|uniref:DUF4245 domain-containing protein n=1 Tax=Pseudonocardia sulfidoxydans NBRC 16205 TaxID=1223511 RepID=A0A511DI43_9PSEU|nr:DUF4245 domain-containing protein [Pseudonocardia sulfidoxydans]GEL24475.1 hypothetical protein PSU4_34290 [Pseudonocardia sulfidoxydans NBRC 16205]